MFYTIPCCNVLQRCASHLGSIRTVAVLPKELAKNFGDRRLKAANLWHTQSKHGNFANFSYSLLILSSRIIFVQTWYCVTLKIKLSRKVMLYTRGGTGLGPARARARPRGFFKLFRRLEAWSLYFGPRPGPTRAWSKSPRGPAGFFGLLLPC